MTCDAMLSQEVLYGVDGLRGVLTSGFVFGVATDFAVLGTPRRDPTRDRRLSVLKDRGLAVDQMTNLVTSMGSPLMAAYGVRREKAALSSGCEAHPAIRSSRKRSEQSWR